MSALRVANLEIVSPAPRGVWTSVVRADPDALPTQEPAWTDAVCSSGRWTDASRLYLMPDGRRLVLPMARRRAAGPAGVEASHPTHWGFGGLLADGGLRASDVHFALDDLAARRLARQSIRPNPLHGPWYSSHPSARGASIARCAHVLDLEGGIDEVWNGFAASRRRAVRKAEKSGVDVECDTSGRLLPEFFALYERSEQRWAEQQHEPPWLARWRTRFRDTLPKWQRISEHLDGECRVWVARHDGQPVASIIVLFGVNVHYTRGAMDKDLAGPLRANDLIMWHAIQAAVGHGARSFHLGESGSSTSLSDYKERFGAQPFDYPELRMERVPITSTDRAARSVVKKLIGFREP